MLLTHGGDRGKSGVREKRWGLLHGVFITKREKAESVTEEGWVLLKILQERRVGFIENTARRHRQGGRCEVTVTSGLHTQKDQDDRLVTTDSIFFVSLDVFVFLSFADVFSEGGYAYFAQCGTLLAHIAHRPHQAASCLNFRECLLLSSSFGRGDCPHLVCHSPELLLRSLILTLLFLFPSPVRSQHAHRELLCPQRRGFPSSPCECTTARDPACALILDWLHAFFALDVPCRRLPFGTHQKFLANDAQWATGTWESH